jgi:hypothetical protein
MHLWIYRFYNILKRFDQNGLAMYPHREVGDYRIRLKDQTEVRRTLIQFVYT